MPITSISYAVPKNLEWWGIGKEATPGTVVNPTVTIPLDSGAPVDSMNMLVDKSLRGDMGEDYNEVGGTVIGDFSMSGNVYLDSIGHVLLNLFGDYSAVGVAGGSGWTSGTITPATTVGGTTYVTSTLSAAPLAGQFAQIGTGASAEVCVVGSGSTTTSLVLAAPGTRFIHAGGAAVKQVVAPFTHTFALLNPAASLGLPQTCQPPTHTITHYNGLQANAGLNSGYTGYRRYGYWAVSGMDFNMNLSNLFQHQSKGTAMLGQDAGVAGDVLPLPVNSQVDAGANPNWRFLVGIGGPASGGTLVSNVDSATISPVRQLVPKYALTNQQQPVEIVRMGLSATGSFTYIAQDESPLLTYLAGTTQQLQLQMTNGTGTFAAPVAGTQGIQFNLQRAIFEQATLSDPDIMAYQVGFRALMNSTDVGASGARGPLVVTLINSVATY